MFFKQKPTGKTFLPPDEPVMAIPKKGLSEKHYSALVPLLNRFLTWEHHFQRITRANRYAGDTEDFLDDLKTMIQEEVVLTKEEFLQKLKKVNSSKSLQEPINALCWITANRPQNLAESLESFSHDPASSNKRFLIFDDSKPENRNSVKSVCEKAREKFALQKINVDLIDYNAKELFIKELSKAAPDVPENLIAFALTNPYNLANSCGANRNMLLLKTAGEKVLSIDDDIHCRIIAGNSGSVEFGAKGDPSITHYFKNSEELKKTNQFKSTSVLELHQSILGKTTGEIIAANTEKQHILIDNLSQSLAQRMLQEQTQATISMAGLAGDSGMETSRMILWLQGDERKKVLDKIDDYNDYKASRQIVRMPPHLTINQGPFLMAYQLGLDNTSLQPPFFPVGRSSESVFNTLRLINFPNHLTAHLTIALLHTPPENRRFSEDSFFDYRFRMTDTVNLLLQQTKGITRENPEANLHQSGKHLTKLGTMRSDDFLEQIKTLRKMQLTHFCRYLESLLMQYHETPYFWAEDIHKTIERIEQDSRDNNFYTPKDIASEEGLKGFQKIIYNFGELLTFWPIIYESAKQLNQK